MILSFGDKYTEEIWGGTLVKGVPQAIQHVARRKLRMLNNSQNINDLRVPPSNHLEKLKGELKDFYSGILKKIQFNILFLSVTDVATIAGAVINRNQIRNSAIRMAVIVLH